MLLRLPLRCLASQFALLEGARHFGLLLLVGLPAAPRHANTSAPMSARALEHACVHGTGMRTHVSGMLGTLVAHPLCHRPHSSPPPRWGVSPSFPRTGSGRPFWATTLARVATPTGTVHSAVPKHVIDDRPWDVRAKNTMANGAGGGTDTKTVEPYMDELSDRCWSCGHTKRTNL